MVGSLKDLFFTPNYVIPDHQARDVHEVGDVDQGAPRDVHGHGGAC